MASSRSNRSLIIGLVVLIVGAALTFVVLQSGGDGDGDTAETISAEEQAAIDARNAEIAAQQAQGQAGGQTVVDPAQVTSLIPRPLSIPEGFQALSVTLDFDAAVAGLPAAGDAINIFGVFAGGADAPANLDGAPVDPNAPVDPTAAIAPNAVKLLAANVEVLAATGPQAQTQAGGNLTVVLAVDTATAEQLIYARRFALMHATLVRPDAEAPTSTAGVDADSVITSSIPDLRPPDDPSADEAAAADATTDEGDQ